MHSARAHLARPARVIAAGFLLIGLVGTLAAPARAAEPRVVVLPTSGVVDPVMSGYVRDGIQRAANQGAAAVVIRLNTPGGSVEATREIVTTLLEAPLPVIVWVAPSGSRAASAGTFITLAAHVAVMAPGTNIGAATPVGGQGEEIEGALGRKVLNDSIATITAIARERGRNVEWAVQTVRDARSSPADEALQLRAIDGIAASLPEVLEIADGRSVKVGGRSVTLHVAGATADEKQMNPLQSFLHLLTDPNIAFILFTLGFFGLLFELQNPNFVTGILGAIAMILAFIGFGSLPLNVGGLLLIGLAVILFALELTVTSHGLLTVAGLVCLALGAGALYTEPGPTAPDAAVALPVLVAVVGTTAAFMFLIAAVAVRTRTLQPPAGSVGLALPPGTVGEVRNPLGPFGSVYAAGEEWTARSANDEPLERGTPVRVVNQDGLTIVVEPAAGPSGSSA